MGSLRRSVSSGNLIQKCSIHLKKCSIYAQRGFTSGYTKEVDEEERNINCYHHFLIEPINFLPAGMLKRIICNCFVDDFRPCGCSYSELRECCHYEPYEYDPYDDDLDDDASHDDVYRTRHITREWLLM